jgi:hypothetical protein
MMLCGFGQRLALFVFRYMKLAVFSGDVTAFFSFQSLKKSVLFQYKEVSYLPVFRGRCLQDAVLPRYKEKIAVLLWL